MLVLKKRFVRMVRRSFKKKYLLPSLARLVVFVFTFTNICFAHKPQTSVWDSRQQKQTYQVAALPTGMNPMMVPSADRTSLSQKLLQLSPNAAPIKPVLQSRRSPLVAGLPENFFAHVNVRSIYRGSSNRTLLLLEDVHQNVEAQTHISQAIQTLGSAAGQTPVTVALEAAHGGFVYNAFRKFPDQKIVTQVADSFLASADISGPAHAGFTFNKPSGARGLDFIGVDDPTLYRLNVHAYKSTKNLKDKTLQKLEAFRTQLIQKKKKIYNARLLDFDNHVEGHRAGTLSMGAYAKTLSRYDAPTSLALDTFLQAYEMENNLQFDKVEAERTQVLEKLVSKMNQSDLQGLIQLSLGYQEGTVTFGDYYQHLKSLCEKNGVNLARAPAFDNYIRYVLLADGINAEKLFKDLNTAEDAVYASLATSDEQRALINEGRQLYLSTQLVNFALTAEEWAQYKSMKHDACSMLHASCENLSSFEKFYIAAEKRNLAMVNNLLATRPQAQGTSVLVAGGFHTPGLTALLKEKGFSVVVVSPKITKIDELADGSHYLSVFDREKTPLEKMFAGQKLFMGFPVAGAADTMLPSARNPVPEISLQTVARTAAQDPKTAMAAARASTEAGVPVTVSATDVESRGDTTKVELGTQNGKLTAEVNTKTNTISFNRGRAAMWAGLGLALAASVLVFLQTIDFAHAMDVLKIAAGGVLAGAIGLSPSMIKKNDSNTGQKRLITAKSGQVSKSVFMVRLGNAVDEISPAVLQTIETSLRLAKKDGSILDFFVRAIGKDVLIDVSGLYHPEGIEGALQDIVTKAIRSSLGRARVDGILKEGASTLVDALNENLRQALLVRETNYAFTERGAEPLGVYVMEGGHISSWNKPVLDIFANPGNTAGLVVDEGMNEGFLFKVEHVDDVLKNENRDHAMWFDAPHDLHKLSAILTRTDYMITAVYPKRGKSKLPTEEPVAVVNPMSSGSTNRENVSPVLIFRAQSTAPATGGSLAVFKDTFIVPGNDGRWAAVEPVTWEEAAETPSQNNRVRVMGYGYQSEGGTFGPKVIDPFDSLPFNWVKERAQYASQLLSRMKSFQSSVRQEVAIPKAEDRAEQMVREGKKEFNTDEVAADVRKIFDPQGSNPTKYTITNLKVDIGSIFGHTRPDPRLKALVELFANLAMTGNVNQQLLDKATSFARMPKDLEGVLAKATEGARKREKAKKLEENILDQNLLSLGELQRLSGNKTFNAVKVFSVGDDLHLVLNHNLGLEAEDVHSFAWKAFYTATMVVNGINGKPYALGQDLLVDSFAGNAAGTGLGFAELPTNNAGVGFLAFDKTGPAAFNVSVFEAVSKAIDEGGLRETGAIYEIWDVYEHKVYFLDGKTERDAILDLLGAIDRYNIKRVFEKPKNWDSSNPLKGVTKMLLSASTEHMAKIAEAYVGKDDPATVFDLVLEEGILEAYDNPYFVPGWMRGAHNGPTFPEELDKAIVSINDGPPLATAQKMTFNDDGKLVGFQDYFTGARWEVARRKASEATALIMAQGIFPPFRSYDASYWRNGQRHMTEAIKEYGLTKIQALMEKEMRLNGATPSDVQGQLEARTKNEYQAVRQNLASSVSKMNQAQIQPGQIVKCVFVVRWANSIEEMTTGVLNAINSTAEIYKMEGHIQDYAVRVVGKEVLIDVTAKYQSGDIQENLRVVATSAMRNALTTAKEEKVSKKIQPGSLQLEDGDFRRSFSFRETYYAFSERGAEPIGVYIMEGGHVSSWNKAVLDIFANPGNTAGLVVDEGMNEGFIFKVEHVDDVLGNTNPNDAMWFDAPHDLHKLSAILTRTDYMITAVYPKKGKSKLPTEEPVAIVRPVSAGSTNRENVSPVLIFRAQSTAPATGGSLAVFKDTFIVPGNDGRWAAVEPMTWKEAAETPSQNNRVRVMGYGYQSEDGTFGPEVIDPFDSLPFQWVKERAQYASRLMGRMRSFQSSVRQEVAIPKAEDRARRLVAEGKNEFGTDEVSAEVKKIFAPQGENKTRYTITNLKVDIGSIFGHTQPDPRLKALVELFADLAMTGKVSSDLLKKATDFPRMPKELRDLLSKATEGARKREKSKQLEANSLDKNLLTEAELARWANEKTFNAVKVFSVGDDLHLVLNHNRGLEDTDVHSFAWKAFYTATMVVNGIDGKPYALGQDLLVDSFAGNAAGTGLGFAELPTNSASAGFLAFDKTGPAAFNVSVYEAVSKAIDEGDLRGSGAIYEIWDVYEHKVYFLDGRTERDAILDLLGAIDRYNIKRVFEKPKNWDPSNPLKGVTKMLLSASTEHMAKIAEAYVGKDDPATVFDLILEEGILAAYDNPYFVPGWMRGAHNGPTFPEELDKAIVSINDGPPLATAQRMTFNNKGQLVGFKDYFKGARWEVARRKASEATALIMAQGIFPPFRSYDATYWRNGQRHVTEAIKEYGLTKIQALLSKDTSRTTHGLLSSTQETEQQTNVTETSQHDSHEMEVDKSFWNTFVMGLGLSGVGFWLPFNIHNDFSLFIASILLIGALVYFIQALIIFLSTFNSRQVSMSTHQLLGVSTDNDVVAPFTRPLPWGVAMQTNADGKIDVSPIVFWLSPFFGRWFLWHEYIHTKMPWAPELMVLLTDLVTWFPAARGKIPAALTRSSGLVGVDNSLSNVRPANSAQLPHMDLELDLEPGQALAKQNLAPGSDSWTSSSWSSALVFALFALGAVAQKAVEQPARSVNWYVIAAIIAALVALIVAISFLVRFIKRLSTPQSAPSTLDKKDTWQDAKNKDDYKKRWKEMIQSRPDIFAKRLAERLGKSLVDYDRAGDMIIVGLSDSEKKIQIGVNLADRSGVKIIITNGTRNEHESMERVTQQLLLQMGKKLNFVDNKNSAKDNLPLMLHNARILAGFDSLKDLHNPEKRAEAIQIYNAHIGGLDKITHRRSQAEVTPTPLEIPAQATLEQKKAFLESVAKRERAWVLSGGGRATRMKMPEVFDKLGIAGMTTKLLKALEAAGYASDDPITDVSPFKDLIDRAESGTIEDADDLSVIQRQVLQLQTQVEQMVAEINDPSLKAKQILEGVTFVVTVNSSNRTAIQNQLAALNFPGKVYVIEQPEVGGRSIDSEGHTHWNESRLFPEGHGQPFIAMATQPNGVYEVLVGGQGIPARRSVKDVFVSRGVKNFFFGQSNDLHFLRDVASVERWATALSAMNNDGAEMVVELTNNALKQQGGGSFVNPEGNEEMRDTIAMERPQFAPYRIPQSLSRMTYVMSVAALAKLNWNSLPAYLKNRPDAGVVSREFYSGDATSVLKSKSMQQTEFDIHTFKERKRIAVVTAAVEMQNDQPEFKAILEGLKAPAPSTHAIALSYGLLAIVGVPSMALLTTALRENEVVNPMVQQLTVVLIVLALAGLAVILAMEIVRSWRAPSAETRQRAKDILAVRAAGVFGKVPKSHPSPVVQELTDLAPILQPVFNGSAADLLARQNHFAAVRKYSRVDGNSILDAMIAWKEASRGRAQRSHSMVVDPVTAEGFIDFEAVHFGQAGADSVAQELEYAEQAVQLAATERSSKVHSRVLIAISDRLPADSPQMKDVELFLQRHQGVAYRVNVNDALRALGRNEDLLAAAIKQNDDLGFDDDAKKLLKNQFDHARFVSMQSVDEFVTTSPWLQEITNMLRITADGLVEVQTNMKAVELASQGA